MKSLRPLNALVLAALCGCGGSGSDAVGISPDPVAGPTMEVPQAIPRLSAGVHVGLIVGFEELSEAQQARTEELMEASVAAGSTISRVQFGWSELETGPGVFDEAGLLEALDAAVTRQQKPFVSLTAIDTGGLTFPADLIDENGNLTAGRSVDDPEVVARFDRFLAWLVPVLGDYDSWGLAIANESGSVFERYSREAITAFLRGGLRQVSTLDADLAATVTFGGDTTEGSPVRAFVRDLAPDMDLVSFNFYCLDSSSLIATATPRWQSDIDTLIDWADGLPIFFQELGCPAGWADTGEETAGREGVIDASPEKQSEFFNFMMRQLAEREELRAATIFQLYDWSPGLIDFFVDTFPIDEGAGAQLTIQRLSEWLGSTGMCRWSNGSCREAWNIYLAGLADLAAHRDSLDTP